MVEILDTEPRDNTPTLATFVPENFAEKYFKLIPQAALRRYERAMSSIYRWKDDHWDEYGAKEDVLSHVKEILIFTDRIEQSYPELAKALNLNELRLMAILHDIGETIEGDNPYTKQKLGQIGGVDDAESISAQRLIQMIKDEDTQKELSAIYARQDKRTADDKEAQMLKFLDVTQGELFGMHHVFPIRRKYGLGYKGCGDVPEPSYFLQLCARVITALGPNEAATREFRSFADATLFHALKHYPPEDVERIRKEIGY